MTTRHQSSLVKKTRGGGGSLSISLFELGALLTDVRLSDYDLPFEHSAPRRYDAEADEPAGGPSVVGDRRVIGYRAGCHVTGKSGFPPGASSGKVKYDPR